jgi:hypothetical protein
MADTPLAEHTGFFHLKKWLVLIAVGLIGTMISFGFIAKERDTPTARNIVLLIPKSQALELPVTHAWMDAAKEEGLLITPMTDDQFIHSHANHTSFYGVILPDTIHQTASDILINTLYKYVEDGGNMLISFDAALLNAHDGTYSGDASRLSHLVGMRYALSDQLKDRMVATSTIQASRRGEKILGIQPGKLDFPDDSSDWGELTTYGYPHLLYSHYRTQADGSTTHAVQTWLKSEANDPIVSQHVHGQGKVLFVNLPLGYLKTRTDSYLLHRMLGFFNTHMLGNPQLSTSPKGQGGLVLNLHLDSNAAQKPLMELESSGWFDDGPYSIHVTAGPDTTASGDGLGINLDQNPWMQHFLRRQQAKGHEIGSHGGWTHNVFGIQVNETNQSTYESYLELNHRSVSNNLGQLMQVYSAPMGNNPTWATHWLRKNAFKAYYSTADTGMGPTRTYIHGDRPPRGLLWAFPISNFRRIATFDELGKDGMDEETMAKFLSDFIQHVSDQHIVRLFYFHPPASAQYNQTIQGMRTQAQKMQYSKQFRWYSMAELSDFMSRRDGIQWDMRETGSSGQKEVVARSASSMKNISWIFPKGSRPDIRVTQGNAEIRQEEGTPILVAGDTTELKFEWTTQRP